MMFRACVYHLTSMMSSISSCGRRRGRRAGMSSSRTCIHKVCNLLERIIVMQTWHGLALQTRRWGDGCASSPPPPSKSCCTTALVPCVLNHSDVENSMRFTSSSGPSASSDASSSWVSSSAKLMRRPERLADALAVLLPPLPLAFRSAPRGVLPCCHVTQCIKAYLRISCCRQTNTASGAAPHHVNTAPVRHQFSGT